MVIENYIRRYAEQFSQLDRNIWNYEDGCVLIGMDDLYHVCEDVTYLNYVKRFIDRYIDETGNIRKYDIKQYNLDFIPSGRVLFDLYKYTGDEKYHTAIECLYSQIVNQPRTKCGSFWHKKIYPNQVWLDGLYMGLPFYTMHEKHFGDGSKFADIMLQFRNCRRYLFNTKDHLYYHAWCESKDAFWADPVTGCSRNYWLRAIGWHLMALTDVYEEMPDIYHAYREELAGLLREEIDGILPYQDEQTGLFFQLPALKESEGNYPETSGSLMIAYALFKGVRLGILKGKAYKDRAVEILLNIELHQFSMRNGVLRLGGICKGAGLGPDGNLRRDGSVAYYLSEPVIEDEEKGAGVCMMAYAEYQRAEKLGLLDPEFPILQIFKEGYESVMVQSQPINPNIA